MPDVLLPFQGLSDPLPSQGSEFTPQFPPQSLDLPSITISRNLVEQDGVLHSSGLHMVGTKFIVESIFLSFALLMVKLWESIFWNMLLPVFWWTCGLFFLAPFKHRCQSNPWFGQEDIELVDSHVKADDPTKSFWFEMIFKKSDSLVWKQPIFPCLWLTRGVLELKVSQERF